MTFLLLILAAWLLGSALAVCLCRMAKQGDQAQVEHVVGMRRMERPRPPRRQIPRHVDRPARTASARR